MLSGGDGLLAPHTAPATIGIVPGAPGTAQAHAGEGQSGGGSFHKPITPATGLLPPLSAPSHVAHVQRTASTGTVRSSSSNAGSNTGNHTANNGNNTAHSGQMHSQANSISNANIITSANISDVLSGIAFAENPNSRTAKPRKTREQRQQDQIDEALIGKLPTIAPTERTMLKPPVEKPSGLQHMTIRQNKETVDAKEISPVMQQFLYQGSERGFRLVIRLISSVA
jgi:hypothetical protein